MRWCLRLVSAALIASLAAGCDSGGAEPAATTLVPVAPSTTIDPPPAGVVDRVVLVGDSLAEESADAVRFFSSPTELVERYYGGTAPCDWLTRDVPADPTTVVAISFTGNNLTPCTADGQGGFLEGDALVDRYRADVTALIDRARAAGAWVLLVGQPAQPANGFLAERVDALNALYTDLASAPFVLFVDAGATVEAPDGSYTTVLPCAPWEPECGPDGRNRVRGLVHFCPEVDVFPCPVYSSGAMRFGAAIAAAAIDPAPYE